MVVVIINQEIAIVKNLEKANQWSSLDAVCQDPLLSISGTKYASDQ